MTAFSGESRVRLPFPRGERAARRGKDGRAGKRRGKGGGSGGERARKAAGQGRTQGGTRGISILPSVRLSPRHTQFLLPPPGKTAEGRATIGSRAQKASRPPLRLSARLPREGTSCRRLVPASENRMFRSRFVFWGCGAERRLLRPVGGRHGRAVRMTMSPAAPLAPAGQSKGFGMPCAWLFSFPAPPLGPHLRRFRRPSPPHVPIPVSSPLRSTPDPESGRGV